MWSLVSASWFSPSSGSTISMTMHFFSAQQDYALAVLASVRSGHLSFFLAVDHFLTFLLFGVVGLSWSYHAKLDQKFVSALPFPLDRCVHSVTATVVAFFYFVNKVVSGCQHFAKYALTTWCLFNISFKPSVCCCIS